MFDDMKLEVCEIDFPFHFFRLRTKKNEKRKVATSEENIFTRIPQIGSIDCIIHALIFG